MRLFSTPSTFLIGYSKRQNKEIFPGILSRESFAFPNLVLSQHFQNTQKVGFLWVDTAQYCRYDNATNTRHENLKWKL